MVTYCRVARLVFLVGVVVGLAGCDAVEWAEGKVRRSRDALCGDFPCAPAQNFYRSSTKLISYDTTAVIIPKSAWDAMLAPGGVPLTAAQRANLQASSTARKKAARLAGIGNDPPVGGLVADFTARTTNIEINASDVLLVANDPQLDGDKLLVTDYFVAAVGLHGTASWGIRGGKFGIATNVALGGNRCCGPIHAAEPITDLGPVPPGCGGDPIMLCADWDTRIYGSGDLHTVEMREATGRPVIEMHMYSTSGAPVELSFAAPLGGYNDDVPCGDVKPICDGIDLIENTAMGGGVVTVPRGPSECGGSLTSSFSPVNKICTQVMSSVLSVYPNGNDWGVTASMVPGSTYAPDCPGVCPNCGDSQWASDTYWPPRQCWNSNFSGDICEKPNSYLDYITAEAQGITAYQDMHACPSTADIGRMCGACKPLSTGSASPAGNTYYDGKYMCTTCTKSSGTLICGAYVGYENGAVACGDYGIACPEWRPYYDNSELPQLEASKDGTPPEHTVPTSLADAFFAATHPCHFSCGGPVYTSDLIPSSVPRPAGGAQGDEPPEKVNEATQTPKKEPRSTQVQDKNDAAKKDAAQQGDPVRLSDGALELAATDLSFPGPARALTFSRFYNSRATTRGPLGSNWNHNHELRIIPLRSQNIPSWVDPYCRGTPNFTTCVLLVSGSSSTLFYIDLTSGVFMPQAGSMGTLRNIPGDILPDGGGVPGWQLRYPDGSTLSFDRHGYLVEDVDRFGNGFHYAYEPTPAAIAMDALCPELPYAYSQSWPYAVTLDGGLNAESPGCLLLYGLTGFYDMPPSPWLDNAVATIPGNWFGDVSGKSAEVQAAVAAVLSSQSGNVYSLPLPAGQGYERLTHIRDDLGRELILSYNADGLLDSVVGPAGTKMQYTYQGDLNAPFGLNERFLTEAFRRDGATAAPDIEPAGGRGHKYEYAWQRTTTMPTDMDDVVAAYTDYFGATYNCGALFPQQETCSVKSQLVRGDIPLLIAPHKRRLYSDAADNIVTVTASNDVTGASRVESETRYPLSYFARDFDRALAQRWGAMPDSMLPAFSPPSGFSDWQTALPLATFEYSGAWPQGNGDRTTAFLPAALATRFPLEGESTSSTASSGGSGLLLDVNTPVGTFHVNGDLLPVHGITIPVDSIDGGATLTTIYSPCRYDELPTLNTRLPGYKPSLDYYDLTLPSDTDPELATPGVTYTQQLKRSRVSCETLALTETYDVRHNDLATTWNETYTMMSLVGRRKHTAANANRICEWVKYTDRDGDVHYSGLNFQGRALVNAVRVTEGTTEKWKIAETLYNADGNVLSQRRTTEIPWSASAGDTRYSYLEVPLEPGHLGAAIPDGPNWQLSASVSRFWTRRANLVRMWERPRGGFANYSADGTGQGSAEYASAGRFVEYGYEPFFNQVRYIKSGNVNASLTDEPLEETFIFHDYLELSSSDPKADALLWDAQEWGARLPVLIDSNDHITGFAANVYDVLGVQFLGQDLNGVSDDGASGLPILVRRKAGGLTEDTRLNWGNQGRLASMATPDGTFTDFQYYELALPQTGAADLNPSGSIARGNAGFLAKIIRSRAWPASAGPNRPSSCAALPSQYRFLLESCGADPSTKLKDLGLSQDAIDGILSAPQTHSIAFNYNALGYQSAVKSEFGARTTTETDTDGRVMKTSIFAAGASTADSYTTEKRDAFRRSTATERRAANGTLLGVTLRNFDTEDRKTWECIAAESNGCESSNSNVAHGWVYTREGDLFAETNEAGLWTTYTRDARKWVTKTQSVSALPTDLPRIAGTYWNDDGKVWKRTYGANETLQELNTIDGYGQITDSTDTEGRVSHYRYSSGGVMTAQWVDGDGAGQTLYGHDPFGRTTRSWKNGVVLADYSRLPGGAVYAVTADGRGTHYVTYDVTGAVAWTEDSAENASVFTNSWVGGSHATTSSRIRNAGALTTGVISLLDGLGRPVVSRERGDDLMRETSYEYDVAGNLFRIVAPDLTETTAQYDWLGRATEIAKQATWIGDHEISHYTYNAQGQLESTVDPAGYESVQWYNGFGEPTHQTGPASEAADWEYDEFGRKTRHTVGGNVNLGYEYVGARLSKIVQGVPGTGAPALVEYQYDVLGRVTDAIRRNPGASEFLASSDNIVHTTIAYDDANRTMTESTQVGQHSPFGTQTHWAFNGSNWSRQIKLPSGRISVVNFDGEGREDWLERASGKSSTFDWVDGILEGVTSDTTNGWARRATKLDPLAQPSFVSSNWNGKPVLQTEFVRDNSGRIATSRTSFGNVGGHQWRGYEYTATGRLDAVHELGDLGPDVTRYLPTFEMNEAVQQAGSTAGTTRWQYERETAVGSIVSIGAPNHEWRFKAEGQGTTPNGQPTVRTDGYRLQAYRNDTASLKSVSFDGAGRMKFDGNHRKFTYDDLGELALVSAGEGQKPIEAYLYDFRGRLVARHWAANLPQTHTELLVYDGEQIVEAYDESESLKWSASWAPGIDNLLSITNANGDEYFALDDGKANVVGWTSTVTGGTLDAYVDYTPEGRGKYYDYVNGTTCEESGETHCDKYNGFPFGFHSAYSSSATGLVYFRNRWYSPEAAQWVSQDPLGNIDSFDEYAFNAFDPVNHYDPFGLSTSSTKTQGDDDYHDGETFDEYCKRTKSACDDKEIEVIGTSPTQPMDMQQIRLEYLGDGLGIPVLNPGSPLGNPPRKPKPSTPKRNPLDPADPRPDLCKSSPCKAQATMLFSKKNDKNENLKKSKKGPEFIAKANRIIGHSYFAENRDNLDAIDNSLYEFSLDVGADDIVVGDSREDEDLQLLSDAEASDRWWRGWFKMVSKGFEYGGYVYSVGVIGRGAITETLTARTPGARPPNLSPPGASRNGAFREAKRKSGVPVSQQPSRVIQNVDKRGAKQAGKIYEFDQGPGRDPIQIRDDAEGHYFGPGDAQNRGPHFNDPDGNHFDYP